MYKMRRTLVYSLQYSVSDPHGCCHMIYICDDLREKSVSTEQFYKMQ